MAGPAFDALEKYKRRHPAGEADHYQIDAVPAGYGERRVREEKWATEWGALIPSLPGGEGKSSVPETRKPSATRGNLTSFEGDIDYERRGTPRSFAPKDSKFFPALRRWITSTLACGAAKSWPCWAKRRRKIDADQSAHRRLPCRSRHYLAGRRLFRPKYRPCPAAGIGTVYRSEPAAYVGGG